MGKLKTMEQIAKEGILVEVVKDGKITWSGKVVFCPEYGRKCQFSGSQEEVDAHIAAVEQALMELEAGIDPFITDTRR